MHDNESSNAWRVLQRSKELDQGPNKTIVWNEHLMRSEKRVGGMRTGDAHK